jgi:protease PrsW
LDKVITHICTEFLTPDICIALALIHSAAFLLLIRFLDLYEREPLSVLALMAVWGAVGAAIISGWANERAIGLLETLFPKTTAVFGLAIVGPLVEEFAKGIALVVAFLLSLWAARRFGFLEFEGVTDGIVYGAAVGLGFAFTEDLLYLFNEGWSVYLERVDLLGVLATCSVHAGSRV